MSNKEYNGWLNKATWNINISYASVFESIIKDKSFQFIDIKDVADAFESLVRELELEPLDCSSITHEAVNTYLASVDWLTIANRYACEQDFYNEPQLEEAAD